MEDALGNWDRLHEPVDIFQQLREVSDPEVRERLRREFGLVGLDDDGEVSDWVPTGAGPQSAINRAIIEGMTCDDAPAVSGGSSLPDPWWIRDRSWLKNFSVSGPGSPQSVPASPRDDPASVGRSNRRKRRPEGPITRLKGRRQPGCLTEHEVGASYDAVSFFNREVGLIFNAFLTIVYPLLGIKDQRTAAKLLWRYNHDAGIWLGRQGQDVRHDYVYVHEAALNHGYHTHLLAYIPFEHRNPFRRWTRKFFATHCGADIPENAFKIQFKIPDPKRSVSHRVAWQWRKLRYMCKELDPGVWARDEDGQERPLWKLLDLPERQPGQQAVHPGQRYGGSHRIWRAAQRRPGVGLRAEQTPFHTGIWSELYVGWELDAWRVRNAPPRATDEVAALLEGLDRMTPYP